MVPVSGEVLQPDVPLVPLPTPSSLSLSLLSWRQRKSKFTLDKELRACWPNRASSALFGIADKDPDYARLALRAGDKDTVRRPRPDMSTTSYRTRKTKWRKRNGMPISSGLSG
ncbi:hypothetical protein X777_01818 [Ooceraea biroi]|uniref:Uncharacterized protein n=1 Tax=Ooceraea biroi TaxID=2015173 RepID=A0A026WMC4_OOCBI|nr:hypothetical protein X777_01818 [Ooceraea biroi]